MSILVSSIKNIDEDVRFTWNNKSFRAWVHEDLDEWIPNFLARNHNSGLKPSPAPAVRATGSSSKSPLSPNGHPDGHGVSQQPHGESPISAPIKSPTTKELNNCLNDLAAKFKLLGQAQNLNFSVFRKRPKTLDNDFQLGLSADGGLAQLHCNPIPDTPPVQPIGAMLEDPPVHTSDAAKRSWWEGNSVTTFGSNGA